MVWPTATFLLLMIAAVSALWPFRKTIIKVVFFCTDHSVHWSLQAAMYDYLDLSCLVTACAAHQRKEKPAPFSCLYNLPHHPLYLPQFFFKMCEPTCRLSHRRSVPHWLASSLQQLGGCRRSRESLLTKNGKKVLQREGFWTDGTERQEGRPAGR